MPQLCQFPAAIHALDDDRHPDGLFGIEKNLYEKAVKNYSEPAMLEPIKSVFIN